MTRKTNVYDLNNYISSGDVIVKLTKEEIRYIVETNKLISAHTWKTLDLLIAEIQKKYSEMGFQMVLGDFLVRFNNLNTGQTLPGQTTFTLEKSYETIEQNFRILRTEDVLMVHDHQINLRWTWSSEVMDQLAVMVELIKRTV